MSGLRREEVALLAGISVEYSRGSSAGTPKGVSESVLEGIVRALQLDEAERVHLIDLVGIAYTTVAHEGKCGAASWLDVTRGGVRHRRRISQASCR